MIFLLFLFLNRLFYLEYKHLYIFYLCETFEQLDFLLSFCYNILIFFQYYFFIFYLNDLQKNILDICLWWSSFMDVFFLESARCTIWISIPRSEVVESNVNFMKNDYAELTERSASMTIIDN